VGTVPELDELESLLAERDRLLERLKAVARVVGNSHLPRGTKQKILALCTDGDAAGQKTSQQAIEPITATRFMTLMDSAPTWHSCCAVCHVGRSLENLWFCSKCGIQY
jgi:hypothetical protein